MHDEQVEQRRPANIDDRHDQAEEQEGDVGRLAAIAGLHQLLARLLLAEPLGQVELLDHASACTASATAAARPSRRAPAARARAGGSSRARARPPSCACRACRSTAAASPASARSRPPRPRRTPSARNAVSCELVDDEVDHGVAAQKSKLIILLHDEDADRTSRPRSRPASCGRVGSVHSSSM